MNNKIKPTEAHCELANKIRSHYGHEPLMKSAGLIAEFEADAITQAIIHGEAVVDKIKCDLDAAFTREYALKNAIENYIKYSDGKGGEWEDETNLNFLHNALAVYQPKTKI